MKVAILMLIPMFLFGANGLAQQDGNRIPPDLEIADIPVGVTSFGGAVLGTRMFFFGGHQGDAHSYSESGQNRNLYMLDLRKPEKWKVLAEGPPLQGLAMVGYRGKLYRLGGFHARNQEGEEHDLQSVADFYAFDLKSRKWEKMPDMPEPRSSFDAVIRKGIIYVVGGWALNGDQPTQWSKTAWSFDLNRTDATWEKLPDPPFQRRALSLGAQGNRIVAIGGMQPKGGPTRKVALFDLKSSSWSDGPELPGSNNMEGFGSSCFNVGGQVIVSTYGGNVYRLAKDFSRWEPLKKLDTGRFFHRLLPLGKDRFALIGGANMEIGKLDAVEVHSVPARIQPAKK